MPLSLQASRHATFCGLRYGEEERKGGGPKLNEELAKLLKR